MKENIQAINEILSMPKTVQAKPSEFEQRFCDCGNELKLIRIPLLKIERWQSKCEDCQKAQKRADEIAGIRQRRNQRALDMRNALERVIPPLYRNTHLRHLAKPLRDKLLQLPRDRGLLMFGPPGAGKTYSMCALARWYTLNQYSVRRISFETLLLGIRGTYDNSESEQRIINRLIECDVLFLEDVGTTTSIDKQESDFSLRTLLLILDERLEHCRPTFITTNKTVGQLAKSFDERIASRLHDCEIVQLQGDDRRKSQEQRAIK